jgi:hypothetical protein
MSPGTSILVDIEVIEQMMRNLRSLRFAQFSGSNIESAIYLARVHRHDLAVEFLCERYGEVRLPRRRGAHDGDGTNGR